MCARRENLKAKHRTHLTFPNGGAVNPKDLEDRFADIPPHERGQLSRTVLSAIPSREREEITTWVKRKCSPDDMPKPGPADPAITELLVFYAVGHHAAVQKTTIRESVEFIIAQKSAAGVILQAHA